MVINKQNNKQKPAPPKTPTMKVICLSKLNAMDISKNKVGNSKGLYLHRNKQIIWQNQSESTQSELCKPLKPGNYLIKKKTADSQLGS